MDGTSREAITQQYSSSANLAARQSIYRYRRGGAAGAFFDAVLDAAAVRADEVVADVGCGNGLYLRALGRRGHRGSCVGVDLSAGILRDAADHAPVACGDAQSLPVRSASVDVALCPHMLYHVPDQAAAVAELRRIVRPDGRAIVVTNSVEHFREVDDLVAELAGTPPVRTMVAFTMEGGERVLRRSFETVDRHDHRGVLEVTDPGAVVAYVDSVRDAYRVDSEALAEVGRRVADVVDRDGAFVVTTASGWFVCS